MGLFVFHAVFFFALSAAQAFLSRETYLPPGFRLHLLRLRTESYLRKQRAPDGLVPVWLGHAGKSITDGYDRVREDVEYRKEAAKAVGIGFTIPTVIVSRVRKDEVEAEKEVAVTVWISVKNRWTRLR